jgi:hypothetical protein
MRSFGSLRQHEQPVTHEGPRRQLRHLSDEPGHRHDQKGEAAADQRSTGGYRLRWSRADRLRPCHEHTDHCYDDVHTVGQGREHAQRLAPPTRASAADDSAAYTRKGDR